MMNKSALSCGIALFAASFAAQADIIELRVTGDASSNVTEGVAAEVTKATAYVVLDIKDGLPATLDYSLLEYAGAIISTRFEFENAAGEPVDLGLPETFELSSESNALANSYAFAEGFDYGQIEFVYAQNAQTFVNQLIIAAANDDLVADYGDNFALYNEISAPQSGVAGVLIVGIPETEIHFFQWTDITALSYQVLLADADNDGIADDVDACSTTDLSETVTLNGMNSGVTNYLDSNGCSIMDQYAACEAEQSNGAGWLGYQGASACETQVGYTLYQQGLISYMELRMLRNALR